MLKTDLIFLGAGASCSSLNGQAFPDGEKLLFYIRDSLHQVVLDKSNWSKQALELIERAELLRRFKSLSNKLQDGNYTSTDKFCADNYSRDPQSVIEMKRAIRFALGIHSWNTAIKSSLYTNFSEILFNRSFPNRNKITSLKNNIAIVNYNYDGLFGYELSKAIKARCPDNNFKGNDWAKITGGHYINNLTNEQFRSDQFTENEFVHHAIHGVITYSTPGSDKEKWTTIDQLLYDQEMIVPSGFSSKLEMLLINICTNNSLIHFPWEIENSDNIIKNKMEHLQKSANTVKSVHFIGLSGDQYLQYSLRPIFKMRSAGSDSFKEIQWNIANIDEEEGTRVFPRLIRCLWEEASDWSDDKILNYFKHTVRFYKGFKSWIQNDPIPESKF